MLRLLIEDVTLTRGENIHLGIRWKGGAGSEITRPLPKTAIEARRTPRERLAAISELAEHHPDREIADILNQRGARSGTGLIFTFQLIRGLRVAKGIPG